jgi:hypothetical protein
MAQIPHDFFVQGIQRCARTFQHLKKLFIQNDQQSGDSQLGIIFSLLARISWRSANPKYSRLSLE